jgi:hypothetical protein
MATLTVRVGLSDIALPLGQVLIIGKQKLIKKLDFKQVSAKFGALVSADHFTNAVASIVSNSASSVPLYMNHAQVDMVVVLVLYALLSIRLCRSVTIRVDTMHHQMRMQ